MSRRGHLSERQIREAAVGAFVARASPSAGQVGSATASAERDEGPHAAHLDSCESCREAVLARVMMLSAVGAMVRDQFERPACDLAARGRSQPAGRASGLRGAAGGIATATGGAALMIVAGLLWGDSGRSLMISADASRVVAVAPPVAVADPGPSRIPLAVAGALDQAKPSEPEDTALKLGVLRSAAYAIRKSIGVGDGPDDVRLDTDQFYSAVMPRLDPVDHWRVVQTALAWHELYPVEMIDGRYGPLTAEALRAYFTPDESAASEPRVVNGRLDPASAGDLLRGFRVVVLE